MRCRPEIAQAGLNCRQRERVLPGNGRRSSTTERGGAVLGSLGLPDSRVPAPASAARRGAATFNNVTASWGSRFSKHRMVWRAHCAPSAAPPETLARYSRFIHSAVKPRGTYQISACKNPNKSTSYRITGIQPNGLRVRENYKSEPEAFTRKPQLEIEALNFAPEKHITTTRLTPAQEADAERAFAELGPRPLLPANLREGLLPHALRKTPFRGANWRRDFDALNLALGFGNPDQRPRRTETDAEKTQRKALQLWTQDILQHTAISHHLAYFQHEGKTAEWAGNSPDIIQRHYKGLAKPADAKAFWTITPVALENQSLPLPAQVAA